VRDFAFPASDERHLGTIVVQSSRNSTQSRTSRWSGFAARFGLFGSGDKHHSHDNSKRSSGPSSALADRGDNGDQGEEDNDEELGMDEVQFDEPADLDPDPFIPGIYRAMYAFMPEGPSEMALEEDQLVSALGRGGGSGWVVVAKDNYGGQALVPEGYLEFYSEFAGPDDSPSEHGARSDTPRA